MKNVFFAFMLALFAFAFAPPPEAAPAVDDASCHIEMATAIDVPVLTESASFDVLDANLENDQDHFAELPQETVIVTAEDGYEVLLCHYQSKSHYRYSRSFEPYNSRISAIPPLQRC